MLNNFKKHLISSDAIIIDALARLNTLAADAILFVVGENDILIGSLTDGDVRRGLLKGFSINDKILSFIQNNPRYLKKSSYSIDEVLNFREGNFKVVPILDDCHRVINIINFRKLKSFLPLDVLIMAGGRGERLKPLTDTTPKPLLKIGDKPIIEHNIDRLISFGVENIWISIKYLGEQIRDYFQDGSSKGINIKYIEENEPLGTIGCAALIEDFKKENVLVMNSDLLTNIDFEDFFLGFIKGEADFSVATIPYDVTIPYAVLETDNEIITSLSEKPTYTYYSNGGIYLMRKELIQEIPKGKFYNATDFIENLIATNRKVQSYPLRGYWLDIGKHEDYKKAQEEIKHIKIL